MNLSLFSINSNFVNQLLGRKDIGIARYFGITIVIIEHLNKVVKGNPNVSFKVPVSK